MVWNHLKGQDVAFSLVPSAVEESFHCLHPAQCLLEGLVLAAVFSHLSSFLASPERGGKKKNVIVVILTLLYLSLSLCLQMAEILIINFKNSAKFGNPLVVKYRTCCDK